MKKGFGIIEVLISTTIISVILGGLVMLGRTAISNNTVLAERTQAGYLAQEGIELVRQIRDSNWVDSDNETMWDWWKIDGNQLAPIISGEYGLSKSRISGIERYALQSGKNEWFDIDNTVYKRTIRVDEIDNLYGEEEIANNARKVTVTVTWGKRSTSISEIITNWRPNY